MAGPVPHRRHVPQAVLHRVGQPQPEGSRAGDLARRDRALGVDPATRHERGRRRAHAGPAAGLRHQTGERAQQVAGVGRVGEEPRPHRRDVVAEDRGELVGVRRAAEVLQQRAVERVPPRLGATAQRVGQPASDHAAPQRLLERRAGAHVHGHRQPAEQTDEAEHVPTVHPRWPIRHPVRRGRRPSVAATTGRRTRIPCRPGRAWRRRRGGRGRPRAWRCRRPRPG